jgi:hypothetical protein
MKGLLIIHMRFLRGNVFLLISNEQNKLIFQNSCGSMKANNIAKRDKLPLQELLL